MLCSCLESTAQQAVMQVNEYAQVTLSGTVQMTWSEGSLQNEGIFHAGTGSTVNFLGTTGEVSGTHPLSQTTFYDLKMDVDNEVVISRDIIVGHQVLFSSGLLLLDHATVTLEGNLIQEDELSRIWSLDNDSYVATHNLYNVPLAQNSGNLGLAITAADGIGQVELRRHHLPIAANGQTGIQRYFHCIPVNPGGYPGTVRFYYFDAELNAQAEQTLTLWHSPDGLNWTNMGQVTASTLENYVEQEVVDVSGYWTLADINHPLPIDLITFSATCVGDRVRVNWTTAELNSSMNFSLERSEEGSHWSVIATLSAEAEDEPTFVLEDKAPLREGLYRIQISNEHGQVRYSPVFPGGCNDRPFFASIWPVPATDRIHLQVQAANGGNLAWRIMTIDGRLVQEGTQAYTQGNSVRHFDVSGIAAGSYVLQLHLSTGGVPQLFKFIKN